MRTTIRYLMIITALLITCFPMGLYGEESDKDIFNQARLAYLDEQYDHALELLDRFKKKFPHSSFYPQVLFYKGQCYIKKKMPQKALDNFSECLAAAQDEFLKQEAEISIIDMNFTLSEKTGRKKHLEEIVRYLKSENTVVQYYSAIILSKAKDKAIASKAVPTLKRIIAIESDEELADRAKIALMRIDPNHLKQPSKPKKKEGHVLVIQSVNKKTRIETFLFKIPFALAGLAMDSLPKDAKEKLKEKGYDLEDIFKTIVQKGQILKIESESSIFKIWIE